jgi:hypothetical protein
VEDEEDIMSHSLLERAGLSRPTRELEERPQNFDPGEYLLDDEGAGPVE